LAFGHATGLPAHVYPIAWPSKHAGPRASKADFFVATYPRHLAVAGLLLEPSTLSSPARVPPCFQATPQRLNFSNAPSPRVVIEPWAPSPRVVIEPQHPLLLPPPVLPIREPISHCTRSHALAQPVPFTAGLPFQECVTYHILTTKFVWAPAEPIGVVGLCKAMQPAEIDSFDLRSSRRANQGLV
jgi:hypothetical protein